MAILQSKGQKTDNTAAKLLYPSLSPANNLIADNGYDSDEFRQAVATRNIKGCIPPKRSREIQHAFDMQLYRIRHKIENMFGRLKD